jgi:hypothetical protein
MQFAEMLPTGPMAFSTRPSNALTFSPAPMVAQCPGQAPIDMQGIPTHIGVMTANHHITDTTKQIAVRLPLDLLAFLEAEAAKDDRTLAYMVRKILQDRMNAAQRRKAG